MESYYTFCLELLKEARENTGQTRLNMLLAELKGLQIGATCEKAKVVAPGFVFHVMTKICLFWC